MGLTPFAFSVHNFISSVGADAGFAAIIGLAILVLLYFAHARETANLREEAAMLAARLQQAEARVAELSRPQPVAVPAAEAVQVTDRRRVIAAPFAPAGTAAPALAAATRVVPLPEVGPEADEGANAEPAVAMAAAPVAVAAASMAAASPSAAAPPPASAAPAPPAPAVPPPAPAVPPPAPAVPPPASASPPAPAPAAPPPTSSPATTIPRPATAAGANGGGRGASAPGSTPPFSSRSSTASASYSPRGLPPLNAPASRGSGARRVFIGLGALLLIAAVAVVLVVLTSGTKNTGGTPTQTQTSNAPAATHAVAFSPSSVTVGVLNGTTTNQLAHHVAARLAARGYKPGPIATAASQTLTSTVVAYLPGARNRTDALHVATALNLRSTAVRPIDQSSRQVACPPPAACTANVVVIVGADLATL